MSAVVESGLKLRCLRCGFDEFKLTAHQLDGNAVGDINTECARCGHVGTPGYIPEIDLEPSRDPPRPRQETGTSGNRDFSDD